MYTVLSRTRESVLLWKTYPDKVCVDFFIQSVTVIPRLDAGIDQQVGLQCGFTISCESFRSKLLKKILVEKTLYIGKTVVISSGK